ncbi:hypothetical protein CH330_07655 [candidate division WOR-3 bacterium JGI_Cruoil_03_51_56]|uniref:DUF4390 domain-containing protein n=1 Tax=candidate division WOR-3 bacterium JGI_Cruoil_03_51_56 TaxID=1973747 RepID=A0A235BSS1_UNCW3|nr:MAG: hypothetical protein CH330_07655 [candidate division WOR-3 bacterium JGI_Cruoil_03_51_56]
MLISVLMFSCRIQPAAPVHFAREEVALSINHGCIETRGKYHFTSSAKKRLLARMFYPFPIDSVQNYPDSIGISRSRFTYSDSGLSFTLKLRPRSEDSFSAYYRQTLKGNSARYIVTTTRKWKRPIDLARFQITVPARFRNVRLNYKSDSVRTTDSIITYFFARCKFFPSEDVIISWESE